MLKKGEKPYDMILAGINLGYFDYNLFPYFHSSQIKNGYNFSQFKKLSLDILLEEAKSTSHHAEKIAELEKKILEILREEQFVKTLYTPIMRNLVDKNIKNYSLKPYLYDDTLRFE
jgi:peptide/nickel transport system substrate-binding protein